MNVHKVFACFPSRPGLWNTRPANLYDWAGSRFDFSKVLLSSFLLHNTPNKSLQIRSKEYSESLEFPTLKDLRAEENEGMWLCVFRTKMSSWISDLARSLLRLQQAGVHHLLQAGLHHLLTSDELNFVFIYSILVPPHQTTHSTYLQPEVVLFHLISIFLIFLDSCNGVLYEGRGGKTSCFRPVFWTREMSLTPTFNCTDIICDYI